VNDLLAQLHLKQTMAFINSAPAYLQFVRLARQSDGAGGTLVTTPSVALAPQLVRAVEQGVSSATITPDGRQFTSDLVVVGPPDLDVQEGDTFEHRGKNYEVEQVTVIPDWRCTAEASRRD
jgi:hypothetical protein